VLPPSPRRRSLLPPRDVGVAAARYPRLAVGRYYTLFLRSSYGQAPLHESPAVTGATGYNERLLYTWRACSRGYITPLGLRPRSARITFEIIPSSYSRVTLDNGTRVSARPRRAENRCVSERDPLVRTPAKRPRRSGRDSHCCGRFEALSFVDLGSLALERSNTVARPWQPV